MIYNHNQTSFTNLASMIRAKTTLNKCMQHLRFTSMFRMFRSRVSIIIYMIRYVWLGCLMMHNMHDLQCLNAGITPGCYTVVVGCPHCHCHENHYHPHHLHQLPYECTSSAELQPQVIIDDIRKIKEELYNYVKLTLLERIYIHTIKQRHKNSFPQHNIINYIT